MPNPFLRPGEVGRNNKPKSDYTIGLVMWVEGKRYFFPGFDPPSAGLLAEMALGRSAIEHPSTRVEWGTRASGKWECYRVLKQPVEELEKQKDELPVTEAEAEKLAGWG